MTAPDKAATATGSPFDPMRLLSSWSDVWGAGARAFEISAERLFGAPAIEARGRARFRELVRHARDRSPLYRELYSGLPEDIDTPDVLPVVDKSLLMSRFDDWVTDPRITRSRIDEFIAQPQSIGAEFLGEYSVWHSSGSSGEPGIFVHDRHAVGTYEALVRVQKQSLASMARVAQGFARNGGRAALIFATEGHFASVACARRAQRANPWAPLRVFPVSWPLERLVAELNDYAPSFVSSYPTALALLAQARQAGTLKIEPSALWCGGEYLSPAARELIESAFGCPLVNEYGCSESLSIGVGCEHGWLHLNADWVLLEPVDRERRPVAAGQVSHTALLTNLANRVAPIIRYDLGDSVMFKPQPCACGSPLPAFAVEGRRADVVTLERADGIAVPLLPLALASALEGASGVHRFQIIQAGARCLNVRLEPSAGQTRRKAWRAAQSALRQYLDVQGLGGIALELDAQAPLPDAASGKLHEVIALRADRHRGERIGPSAPMT